MFHCHIEFHVEVGMAVIFKVGDHAQMPRVPRGFPTCGNYFPASSTLLPDQCQSDNSIVNALKTLLPDTLNSAECSASSPTRGVAAWGALLLGVVITALMT